VSLKLNLDYIFFCYTVDVIEIDNLSLIYYNLKAYIFSFNYQNFITKQSFIIFKRCHSKKSGKAGTL